MKNKIDRTEELIRKNSTYIRCQRILGTMKAMVKDLVNYHEAELDNLTNRIIEIWDKDCEDPTVYQDIIYSYFFGGLNFDDLVECLEGLEDGSFRYNKMRDMEKRA